MSRFSGEGAKSSFTFAIGWLFADLLLGLFMVFLVANTVATRPPPTPVAQTPTQTVNQMTPTPTPLPRLELTYYQFSLNVNPDGLLNDQQDAINAVTRQIMEQPILKGRRVGLVIIYAGAPDDTQITSALLVVKKVYAILAQLGKQNDIFREASYYNNNPLYILGAPRSSVVIHVFL